MSHVSCQHSKIPTPRGCIYPRFWIAALQWILQESFSFQNHVLKKGFHHSSRSSVMWHNFFTIWDRESQISKILTARRSRNLDAWNSWRRVGGSDSQNRTREVQLELHFEKILKPIWLLVLGSQFKYRSVREHNCFLNSLCHGMWSGNGWIFERSHDVAVNWKIESSWFWDAFDKKIAFTWRKIISNASHRRNSQCWKAANSKVQFLIWKADYLTSLRLRQRRPRFWCKIQSDLTGNKWYACGKNPRRFVQ